MAWGNKPHTVLPGNRVRTFNYLVFIAKSPDGETADDGNPYYIVCIPDIPGAVTQGFGEEDAYFMGRDAASLLLENIPAWKVPAASPYNVAEAKVLAEFADEPGLEWSARWVKMLVPYRDMGLSKYCIPADKETGA